MNPHRPNAHDPDDTGSDAERWQQVKGVLYDALERSGDEREALLDRACADDAALRAEVEDLLAAHDEAAGFFDAPPVLNTLLDWADGTRAAGLEREVGPYRILHLLGQGGMAEVFLAERADGLFDRRVALKLVKYLDAESLLRRFETERQILAGLRHPNIARLLDGGTADDGRPYFAMEYVAGEPLTAHARSHDLPLEERLHLVIAVGEAVHHAHRNLVVHRDLKPSNILVETDDEQARVKLLDFGIAKVLTEEPEPHVLTETGVRPMTRAYAAPEQIRGESVTTATDIYALGVVLYELLTGRRPFEAETRHALERAILDTEPETPSTAVRRAPSAERSAGTAAARTALDTGEWAKRLKGDLDVICLKALSKEPADRYASAEAFVADLRRYLNGLPIEARPPTRGYRLRKFVRRNRLGVASAVLGVLVLVAFSGAMTWQQAETARERDRAERELARAETATTFLTDLFEANNPSEARGDTLTARDLLVRGRDRLDALEDQPEIQARMLHVIGGIYQKLGEYGAADSLTQQALAERRRLLGEAHEDVAESIESLADLRSKQGRYDEAIALHTEALRIRRDLFGENDSVVLETLSDLAVQYKHQGEYAEAKQRFEEVLAKQRAAQRGLYEEVDPRIGYTLNSLGRLLDAMYEYEASLAHHQEALAIFEQGWEEDHPEVIYTKSNIGGALSRLGRYDEAAQILEEVVVLRRRVLGPEHPGVATSLSSLALAEVGREAYDRAVELYTESEQIYRSAYEDTHPSIAAMLFNRGVVHERAGRWEKAEIDYRAALAMRREVLGEDHVRTVHVESFLGRMLLGQNETAAAEPLLLHALAVLEEKRGPNHTATRDVRDLLAELYESSGQPEEAARYAVAEPKDAE